MAIINIAAKAILEMDGYSVMNAIYSQNIIIIRYSCSGAHFLITVHGPFTATETSLDRKLSLKRKSYGCELMCIINHVNWISRCFFIRCYPI